MRAGRRPGDDEVTLVFRHAICATRIRILDRTFSLAPRRGTPARRTHSARGGGHGRYLRQAGELRAHSPSADATARAGRFTAERTAIHEDARVS
jgi:hypothetical protein